MKAALLIGAAIALAAPDAHAFCGFYVNPGDGPMFNDATEVVLMRAGTRTVLAMQNNYQGPPKDFALVVPVPAVLHDGDVKTIDSAIFAKVDRMSSPRLVEYWEQDPIPTNLDVKDDVRKRFGEFYAALFDRTVAANPGAVVTEYAWDASTCDPCPGPELDGTDFATLGADVIGEGGGDFVLTRLHARYGKTAAPNDLVFRAGKPIVGGREERDDAGKLEERSRVSEDVNNFQGRYAIRHPWTGPIACASPVRGVWGEDPNHPDDGNDQIAIPAVGTAFAPRGQIALPQVVVKDIPEIGVVAGVGGADKPSAFHERPQGCGCQSSGVGDLGGAVVGLGFVVWRRRAKRRIA